MLLLRKLLKEEQDRREVLETDNAAKAAELQVARSTVQACEKVTQLQSKWGDDFMLEFDKLVAGTEAAARAKRKYEAAALDTERVQAECKANARKAQRVAETQKEQAWQLRRNVRELERTKVKCEKSKKAAQAKARRHAEHTMLTMSAMPMDNADARRALDALADCAAVVFPQPDPEPAPKPDPLQAPQPDPEPAPIKDLATRSGTRTVQNSELSQYQDKEGTLRCHFMAIKKGGKFAADYKWVQYDFLCRMSQTAVVGALEVVGRAFKMPAAVVKKLVPSRTTIQNAAVEMLALSDIMIAETVSNAERRTLAFDGSNNGLKDLQSIQAHVSDGSGNGSTAVHLGAIQKMSKTGKDGAEALIQRMNDVNETVAAARNKGATVNSTQPVHPIMFAGSQGGGMSDHCLIEGVTFDELERICCEWCAVNFPDWSNKTREEQDDMTHFARAYCFAHKADNLAKAVKTSLKLYRLRRKALTGQQKKELYLSSATTWCWCAHKCLGMPGSVSTDLNLNVDFKLWLKSNGKEEDLKLLASLGPLVGDR